MKGKEVFLKVIFPYLGEKLKKALSNSQPICFGYKIKTDRLNRKYIVFTASFDKGLTKRFNTDISTGIIAIDINFGHIDITNLNEKGNLIDSKTIYFDITDNKRKNELNLRKAIKEVGCYVKDNKKILAKEDLNLEKLKAKCKYNNKKYNKMLHYFPFSKVDDFINNEAYKNNFEVIKVKPNYTSIIGKYKYSDSKKLNTHISASFVIGRRALRFKENIPKKYKHIVRLKNYLSKDIQWSLLNKELKKLDKNKTKKV